MPMKPIIPVYAIATAVIIDASVSIKNFVGRLNLMTGSSIHLIVIT